MAAIPTRPITINLNNQTIATKKSNKQNTHKKSRNFKNDFILISFIAHF